MLQANVLGSEAKSLRTKVFQVEASLGILLRREKNGSTPATYHWLAGEFPTSLYALERTTALHTWAALRDVAGSVPEISELAQRCKFAVRHSSSDKYTANLAAEKHLSGDLPGMCLLHTYCGIHRLYTCTSTSMKNSDADVTGVLNLALTLGSSGSVAGLRQVLCRILLERLVVRHEEAPEDADTVSYREGLFDTFMPVQGVPAPLRKLNAKRRYVINRLLNGRLQFSEVQHWCVFSCCPSPDLTVRCIAIYLTWAMIPCQLPKFARSRWTNWDTALNWTGLLAGA